MDQPFDAGVYFNSRSFSDVVIRFSGREIKAHRIFLCSKSPYFQKALGPDSNFKESNDGVLELQEDDPLAVEQMLRYVYTSQYTYEPMMRDATTWETHFNVMIVADKYGLPNLEELAYKKCEEHITRLQMTDKMLFRLVERSWEYGDRQSRFSKLIASLSAVSGSRFPELFNNSQFRPWIDAHPVVISPLIGKHFATLMRYQSFRNKISNDPAMALEHLDRLSSRVSSCYECKRAGF